MECLRITSVTLWNAYSKTRDLLGNARVVNHLTSFNRAPHQTGELDQPEVHPIVFPRSPAFRQGTFCQNLLSGVRVTFTQPQNERLAYEFVYRLAPLRLIHQKNLKANSLPIISQSRMLVRAVRFSEYQIIFADFILPQYVFSGSSRIRSTKMRKKPRNLKLIVKFHTEPTHQP